jgi:cytochrome P450
MLHYPEVQKKCHEEIDRVVGPDRMPTHDDAEDLPYIRAAILETLRFVGHCFRIYSRMLTWMETDGGLLPLTVSD